MSKLTIRNWYWCTWMWCDVILSINRLQANHTYKHWKQNLKKWWTFLFAYVLLTSIFCWIIYPPPFFGFNFFVFAASSFFNIFSFNILTGFKQLKRHVLTLIKFSKNSCKNSSFNSAFENLLKTNKVGIRVVQQKSHSKNVMPMILVKHTWYCISPRLPPLVGFLSLYRYNT